ncbi:uncharacterized protein G2W53_012909 [Senna tora]|uniref:Uncharacterized protein n=1 Tax=Senna tora TaxID=362788 RepID=A0A834U1I2_9FABA|nr:uncharacterized protein G2W53_012909 [Senna tora]
MPYIVVLKQMKNLEQHNQGNNISDSCASNAKADDLVACI